MNTDLGLQGAALTNIVIVQPNPVVIVGSYLVPVPYVWPAKDPKARVIYGAEFGPALAYRETIVSAQVRVLSTGTVYPQDYGFLGGLVWLLLVGGVDGEVATVSVIVTTSQGQAIVRTIALPIVASVMQATPSMPSAFSVNGSPLLIGGLAFRIRPPPSRVAVSGQVFTVNGIALSIGDT